MAVTIKDIAKKVGRSVTTVSRAHNGYDDVSAATRELIEKTARELGYTPNTYAQRLQKQRSDTIGFIIPTFGPRFSDPFFSEFIAGIGNKASQLGFDVLVSTCAPGEEEMNVYRSKVEGKRVDGLIIIRTRQQDPRIQYLVQRGFPFVSFGRTRDNFDFPYVDEDSFYGMKLVVDHLCGQGHRRIACIAPPSDFNFGVDRLEGFIEGIRETGLSHHPKLIKIGDLTQRDGYRCTSELLDISEPPTAIVACNDLMAFGALRAVRERGLEVGRDIAVTGFDDIPMAEHADPPLTTVHQPIYQIGTMVCDMLIDLIVNSRLENSQIVLKPRLIIRQSSHPTV